MNKKIDDLRNEAFGLVLELEDKELWKSLEDGVFFAVNALGEEPSFVEVRTLDENQPVLNVYWNKEDLGKTNLLNRIHYCRIPFSIYSSLTEQNLAQIAFDEKDRLVDGDFEHFSKYAQDRGIDISEWERFPNIISFETGLYPREINDEEKLETLVRCLNAAVEVTEKLKSKTAEELGFGPSDFYFPSAVPLLTETAVGFDWDTTSFPDKESEEVITVEFDNDDLRPKVKSLEKGLYPDAFLVRLPVPVTAEGTDSEKLPPFYPIALIMAETHKPDHPIYDFFGLQKDYTEESLKQLLDRYSERLIELGKKPHQINCFDDRTVALLRDFGKKTSIKVVDRRLANNDEYDNSPVRIYSDVKVSLDKFEPMPDEILRGAINKKNAEIAQRLLNISVDDMKRLFQGETIEVEGIGELDYWSYLKAMETWSRKATEPENRIEEIDCGIFPENYDEEDELRSFNRLKPPKGSALSYVFSITYKPGNYVHAQMDGDETLEQLTNYAIDNFGSPSDGYIAMDNKLYTDAHMYEMPRYEINPEDIALMGFNPEEFDFEVSPEDNFRYNYRCFTDEITLKDLNLQKGQKFRYVFYDGERDSIHFKVLRAVPEETEDIKVLRDKSSKIPYIDEDDWF